MKKMILGWTLLLLSGASVLAHTGDNVANGLVVKPGIQSGLLRNDKLCDPRARTPSTPSS